MTAPILERFYSVEQNSQWLNEIYDINQANTPEVGPLDSIQDLENLISLSAYNLVAVDQGSVVGFIICMREGTNYGSENYKFFLQKLKKFLYVDRVAITKDYRRAGLGKAIYEKIFLEAKKNVLPLALEVNTEPLNQPSLNFHELMGFDRVGSKDFHDHSVAYFIK
jgi:predicted GNAT superfamily acetyltransferase